MTRDHYAALASAVARAAAPTAALAQVKAITAKLNILCKQFETPDVPPSGLPPRFETLGATNHRPTICPACQKEFESDTRNPRRAN